MRDSSSGAEPLEDRAAKWLNGLMWYGLASLAAAFGVWTLISSVWDPSGILEGLSFVRRPAIDSNRALVGLCFLVSALLTLLPVRRKSAR